MYKTSDNLYLVVVAPVGYNFKSKSAIVQACLFSDTVLSKLVTRLIVTVTDKAPANAFTTCFGNIANTDLITLSETYLKTCNAVKAVNGTNYNLTPAVGG